MNLDEKIERLFGRPSQGADENSFRFFDELKQGLNEGRVRAAEPDANSPTGWKVNAWVKKGILLGFRIGRIVDMPVVAPPNKRRPSGKRQSRTGATVFQFRDKNTYPLQHISADKNVRVVPGGSSIRDGCYIGKDVVCMPPMFVNVGAYVDNGTMIDSHALVGSCAQVGKKCHLSAGAQIGGVIEPVGAMPVIIEDEVLVGGNCGVYEGAIVQRGAVLASGTILTGSTPVYDLVRERVYRREGETPLIVPAGAVVVPGARAVTKGRGKEWGISLYTPVIIKYRDEKTDQSTRLEDLLR